MIENSYSFSFAASGGLAPLLWSETGTATLALGTGSVVAGTTATTGSFAITVVVQDALGQKTAPQNFTITVINPPPPSINTTPPPTAGVQNHPYSFTFTATAGYPPLVWAESGALPAGLQLSAAGIMSGTPTVAGSFPFTVMAQDSHGEIAGPQNFSIQIFLGFDLTGSMGSPRLSHTATLLVDGTVLVVGGLDANGNALASAEIFDPVTEIFSSTSDMKDPRVKHTATLLTDGRVLVAGGQDTSGNPLQTAEIFNPATRSFSPITDMAVPRTRHTAALLHSGKVLLAGGFASAGNLDSAELFDPSNPSFTLTTVPMTVARAGHTATLLNATEESSLQGQV